MSQLYLVIGVSRPQLRHRPGTQWGGVFKKHLAYECLKTKAPGMIYGGFLKWLLVDILVDSYRNMNPIVMYIVMYIVIVMYRNIQSDIVLYSNPIVDILVDSYTPHIHMEVSSWGVPQ